MSPEQNKAVSRRFIEELFNKGNLAVADEIIAPQHMLRDPGTPGLPMGPQGSKQYVQLYRNAFPDAKITVEDQIAEGDRVVTRWTGRGTHRGELPGIPASGRPATVSGITIDRFSPDGKIVESWSNWDTLGLMVQLGAVHMPEPART